MCVLDPLPEVTYALTSPNNQTPLRFCKMEGVTCKDL
jgi:hypothetical protein